jgi:hypothetical protein
VTRPYATVHEYPPCAGQWWVTLSDGRELGPYRSERDADAVAVDDIESEDARQDERERREEARAYARRGE